MTKLLVVLIGLLIIGGASLHLRHQQIELRHRMATLHRELQTAQSTLWRQQLDIATNTSPQTIRTLVGADTDITVAPDAAIVDSARE